MKHRLTTLHLKPFQGFSGFYGSIEDRLQNDAQTVVNFLSDGAVVDAIMSIERKSSRMVDDDEDDYSNIKKIDFTNPPSKILALLATIFRHILSNVDFIF